MAAVLGHADTKRQLDEITAAGLTDWYTDYVDQGLAEMLEYSREQDIRVEKALAVSAAAQKKKADALLKGKVGAAQAVIGGLAGDE